MIDRTIQANDIVIITNLVHVDDLGEYDDLIHAYTVGERYHVITVLDEELCFVKDPDDEVSEWFSSRLFEKVSA